MTGDAAAFRARYGPCALVAGAAEGLGAAWARALAARGLEVVLVDVQADRLSATAAALRAATRAGVHTVVADLGRPDAIDALVEATRGLAVGLVVYNAARSVIGDFLDRPLADALAMLDVNCRGALALAHVFGGAMAARGHGGLIVMSPLAGDRGAARLAVYAATKAFLLVLGESLWMELRARGVDVLAVRPGSTRTPGWEASQPDAPDPSAPPPMEPDEVVAAALAALGTEPSVVTGEANLRAAELLAQLPRRQAIELMSGVTTGLRPTPGP